MKTLQQIWDRLGELEERLPGAAVASNELQLYMSRSPLVWSRSIVDDENESGRYCSAAIGSDGRPAASYFDRVTNRVKYAELVGGSWVVTDVAPGGPFGTFTSLAFDPNGNPCFTFTYDVDAVSNLDANDAGLYFARRVNGVWGIEAVDTGGSHHSFYTSLAFGPDGHPAVSYHAIGPIAQLKFARFNGTAWETEVVAASGRYNSLKFGPNGMPSIAYTAGTTVMRYISHDGAQWGTPEDVGNEASGSVEFNLSLAFGPDGRPAIAYRRGGGFGVRFAKFNGSVWNLETLNPTGSGTYVSLAYGPDGEPAVAYRTATGLDFARGNAGNWETTTVVAGAGAGHYVSLAFGRDGLPWMVYYHNDEQALNYRRLGIFTGSP